MSNSAKHDKTFKLPKNALYRSYIEICRMLQLLAKNHTSIYADIGISKVFVSHVLLVDLRAKYFVASFCANKPLNSEMLQLPSLKFTANYQNAHFIFEGLHPVETQFKGQPAIMLDLPHALIIYNRREHPRISISPDLSLRCVADAGGVVPFESYITDISHDGLGGILYDHGIKLKPKTILKGCRIITPNGTAVVADLELRHVVTITLPDGTLANHAGLHFIQRPGEIAELISFFIRDLDKQ